MSSFRARLLAALAALMLWAPVTSAEAPPLMHAGSAYVDAKGKPLRMPEGIACTDSGRVVAADTANSRLLMYSWRNGEFSGGDELKFEELGRPLRVQIDTRGNILSLDQKSRRIVRVGQDGSFAGFVEFKGVPALKAAPFAVSFKLDRADNLYVLDVGTGRVLMTDPDGNFIRALPLPKRGAITDLAIDRSGTVYIVDAVKAQVLAALRGEKVFTSRSKSLKDFMNFPGYLTTTENGRLVLVDKNGSGLVVVTEEGKFQGRQLSLGANDGMVYYPGQICLAEGGVTYVADRNNHRIQAFVALSR
jgi:hypothetical protein